MKKIIIENTKIIAIATILSITIGIAGAASTWTAPTQPAPNGNIEAPLNVSVSGQSKKGNLIIYGLNSLDQPVANALTLLNGDLNVQNGNINLKGNLTLEGKIIYKNAVTNIAKQFFFSGNTSPVPHSGWGVAKEEVKVTPITAGNVLSITNIQWRSNTGGNYNDTMTIYYSDGSNKKSTIDNNFSLSLPILDGYNASIDSITFTAGGCSTGGCQTLGNAAISGYETIKNPNVVSAKQFFFSGNTSPVPHSGWGVAKEEVKVTPITAGNVLSITNIQWRSNTGGNYNDTMTIYYSDGSNKKSTIDNNFSLSLPISGGYSGSIESITFTAGGCSTGGCQTLGNVIVTGYETVK